MQYRISWSMSLKSNGTVPPSSPGSNKLRPPASGPGRTTKSHQPVIENGVGAHLAKSGEIKSLSPFTASGDDNFTTNSTSALMLPSNGSGKNSKSNPRVAFTTDSMIIDSNINGGGGDSSNSDVMELSIEDEEREEWDNKTRKLRGQHRLLICCCRVLHGSDLVRCWVWQRLALSFFAAEKWWRLELSFQK